jgi:hypothetical protein
MKNAITGLLLAGATSAFMIATPAFAQVAGNPGDLHTPTPYTNDARANTAYGYTPGSGGPLGPLGVIAAPLPAPVAIVNGTPGAGACGVSQDFNGRLTALCGL